MPAWQNTDLQHRRVTTMTPQEFDAQYREDQRCHAVYRDRNGYQVRGLVSDTRYTSKAGHPCVTIDGRGHLLADVIRIEPTGMEW